MTILCCDTSTDYAVFALADQEGQLLASLAVRHGRELSRRFFDALDLLFRAAGSSLGEVDVLAAGLGPGSFTGVRVAVTTFATMAQATGKRLVGVGTLDAYGMAVSAGLPEDSRVVAVLPSRKEEVYAAVYAGGGALAEGPLVATHDELKELVGRLAGRGPLALCGAVPALPRSLLTSPHIAIPHPPAYSLALLAALCVREGRFADPLAFTPLYLAPPAISQHKSR